MAYELRMVTFTRRKTKYGAYAVRRTVICIYAPVYRKLESGENKERASPRDHREHIYALREVQGVSVNE